MISIEELAEILNKEINEEFIDALTQLWYDEENYPIDPEHPDMEPVLEKIADSINDLTETLPLEDDYV
jgi:hypothetical protein